MDSTFIQNLFSSSLNDFEALAQEVFHFQYAQNKLYKQWCDLVNRQSSIVNRALMIPFLPISFFKTHQVIATAFVPQRIFESSGTTTTINSKHFIKDTSIYTESFTKAFELLYGDINEYCIIGLLPSYLERNNSSLVMMVDAFIKQSNHVKSGFYLNEFDNLHNTLKELENAGQKTLLIGVTFALIDFAEAYPIPLQHTIIMDTGGMKGRKAELTRDEMHDILKQAFGLNSIHSEYGMTELLSQAYAKENGRFYCPPWMQVFVRSEDDPMNIRATGKGIINIIDLANIYSCSFIATDDLGIVYEDGSFEITGRLDNKDIRGCSLLFV